MSISLLICLIYAVGYTDSSYRSYVYSGTSIENSQVSSLKPFLLWETNNTSKPKCAVRCLETSTCISFLIHRTPCMCQLFSVYVDFTSGLTSADMRIYQRQVSCEEFGYLSLTSTKKCLKLYSTPKLSWIDANSTCASADGKLFSITSAIMFADILNVIAQKDSTFKTFSIDGNDMQTETDWVFSDGSPVSFLQWGRFQPNPGDIEDCLLIMNGEYHDAPCTTYLSNFICERDFSIVV